MEPRLTDKPTEDVIAAIRLLDLESVKARIMDPELGLGWSHEYADQIASAYKTYLTMLAKYPDHAEEIMLAKDVDEFWHTHILQTVKYVDDCMSVFGRYLHHAPHVGERSEADLKHREVNAETTRQLYEREFGDPASATMAWAGARIETERAAYSAVALPGRGLAYSAATLARNSAYSAAAIDTARSAYSAARIEPQKSAYSAAKIVAREAAYSAARIRAQDSAYSAATIDPAHAAYSAATIGGTRPQ